MSYFEDNNTIWIAWNHADQFWTGHRGDKTFSLGFDGGLDSWREAAEDTLTTSVGVDRVIAQVEVETDEECDELVTQELGTAELVDGKTVITEAEEVSR